MVDEIWMGCALVGAQTEACFSNSSVLLSLLHFNPTHTSVQLVNSDGAAFSSKEYLERALQPVPVCDVCRERALHVEMHATTCCDDLPTADVCLRHAQDR